MPDDSDNSALCTSADSPLSAETNVLETASVPTVAADPFALEDVEEFTEPAPTLEQAVERAGLADGFASIENQLPKPVTAKLKMVDTSTAMIQLKCNGQTVGPLEIAFLIAGDFASNCIQALGTDGLICCTVNGSVKGKKFLPFHFAFAAQASAANKAVQTDPMQALTQQISRGFQELEARHKKEIDDLKLEIAISGGGGKSSSFADELENFQKLAGILKTLQPAAAAVTPGMDMSSQVQGMVTLLGGVTDMQTKLKEAAGVIAPDKSFAQEAKELLEIPVLNDAAGAVVDGVKAKIAGKQAAASPSAEPNEPDVDPFSEVA